ncbi:hypothetical protein N7507_007045 [Penicillium longicatenatum]|nr:hypothetical protein N7507_007045 [Penicillium longicatenatum]
MKSTIAIAALVAGANALVGRSDSCCFQLTASGSATGTLGQLSDGQVRLGDTTLSAAEFCISNSIITDSEGRGCVVTSYLAETTQFQCDEGATGTSGFSLASSGLLSFDSSSSFIACQTGENDGRNIYTTNSTSVTECVKIQLTGDSCGAAASSSVASSVAAVAPTSSIPVVVESSTPVPVIPTTSRPLIPTSPAKVSTPAVASTSAAEITSHSTTASSTTSTSSTTSASASSAASTAPTTSGSAITAPMGFAHWVASIAIMLSVMVLY